VGAASIWTLAHIDGGHFRVIFEDIAAALDGLVLGDRLGRTALSVVLCNSMISVLGQILHCYLSVSLSFSFCLYLSPSLSFSLYFSTLLVLIHLPVWLYRALYVSCSHSFLPSL
jgi:hypothetical protein